ncbi:MAG: SDR family oxidoreductase [Myxococcales bacterium]|nr:SDR family oxidoreductase [Myxococcales bacterium]
MQGKVVLVTGATNGIGKQAATEIAAHGATVVVVGRNAAKTEETVKSIKAACGHVRVDSILADLSVMSDIRQVAKTFLERYDRLDVLLNNAGAMFEERKLTKDGYEMSLALNHLSYFLLTNLLLDTLKDTAAKQGEARVVSVSSGAHVLARKGVLFDDIHAAKSYSPMGRYGETKLMNLLFTFALARRLEGTQVTANALHPGFVDTGFGNDMRSIMAPIFRFAQKLFGRNEGKGAETSVFLATDPSVKGVTGGYFIDKKQRKTSKIAQDQAQQEQLWDLSLGLVGLDKG